MVSEVGDVSDVSDATARSLDDRGGTPTVVIDHVSPPLTRGRFVRWYWSVRDAEAGRWVLSASRAGVDVGECYLTDLAADALRAAYEVHERLLAVPNAALSVATHVVGVFGGSVRRLTGEADRVGGRP